MRLGDVGVMLIIVIALLLVADRVLQLEKRIDVLEKEPRKCRLVEKGYNAQYKICEEVRG